MKVRLTPTGTPLLVSASLGEASAFTVLLSPLPPQLHLKKKKKKSPMLLLSEVQTPWRMGITVCP